MSGALFAAFALGLLGVDSLDEGPALTWIGEARRALASMSALIAGALVVLFGAVVRGQRARGARRASAHIAAVAWIVALVVAATAGAMRLARDLECADRDAALALSIEAQGGTRRIEGRVLSRRDQRWGSEVVLGGVVAVDTGGSVPRKLRLAWGRRERDEADALGTTRLDRGLWPGASVRMAVRITPLRFARNPGQNDRGADLRRRGLGAGARLVDPAWVVGIVDRGWSAADLRVAAHRARTAWRARVREAFEAGGERAGLVLALALGDRSALSDPIRKSFRTLGISHLIAISGLHVGLVAGGVTWAVRRALAGRSPDIARRVDPWLVPLSLGFLAAAAYGWLSGAGPAVQRATVVFGVAMIARWLGRGSTPAAALGWAGLVVLAVEPAFVFDLGARLSFAACGALVWGGFWREDRAPPPRSGRGSAVGQVWRYSQGLLRASTAISLVTAPLAQSAGLPTVIWSPLVNVLAVPITAAVVLPSAWMAVLGSGWLPEPFLRALLAPARAMEEASVWAAARLPALGPMGLAPLEGVVVIGLLGLLALRGGRVVLPLLAWAFVAANGSLPASGDGRLVEPPRVVFFDVGQGDAALVQGRDATLLIDAGGSVRGRTGRGEALARSIRSLGAHRIDILIVSHGDADHRGGVPAILAELPVREVWLPAGCRADLRVRRVAVEARQAGAAVRWLERGFRAYPGVGLVVDVLWPPDVVPPASPAGSWNDRSLVLRVALEGHAFLFAADVGEAVERALIVEPEALASEVLKVGHHGSARSSSDVFLRAIAPRLAVVSAPCRPTRGLPHPDALRRLDRADTQIAWTGRDGAVSVGVGRNGGLVVTGWSEVQRACP